jgi:hypothetical protein
MSTRSIRESLKEKLQQQALLLDTLRLWDEVKAQGIEPEEVESFSFRDDYLTQAQRMVLLSVKAIRGLTPLLPATHHNAIKVNGEWRPLKPALRRPTPCLSPSESSPA